MGQIGVALGTLSPEGRGWGEGARKLQKNLQLPNPSSCPSPLWGEGTQRLVHDLSSALSSNHESV
jgi:hypothetical protein